MSYPEPTPNDVQDVLDTTLDTESLQAHIDASSHDIKDIELADPTISDDRLTDMHKYYAAHFASSQEQRLSSQSGESRSLSYATDESADYLEIAQRIDPTGELAQSAKPKAGLSVPDTKGISDT